MNVADLTLDKLIDLLDALPLGIVLLKPSGDTFEGRLSNKLAAQLFLADPLGQDLFSLAPHLRGSDLHRALTEAASEKVSWRLEQFFSADESFTGKDRWYDVTVQPFGEGLLLTFEDVTQQKQVEGHIRQMAFQDDLTGIYNRRYFMARTPGLLALARREAWNCALLFFDLNGFKAINDAHGHKVGDQVLQAVAWRLSQVSRDGDIFFRSGGDEFAFFLPNTDEASALTAAKRIASALGEPVEVEGAAHRVGVSIGVAVMLSEDASVDTLLERADQAMYAAKERKLSEPTAITVWTPELKS